MRFGKIFGLATCFAIVSSSPALAAVGQPANPAPSEDIRSLRGLLNTPESQVDFAKAKITIDRFIDPKIDAAAVEAQLDKWVSTVRARFPADASRQAKLDLLISTLYEPGPWNGQRPFQYDLGDPFGRTIQNKLLPTYLNTRKGNCVSMPILLLILGQKLGLPLTVATAPEHLLVKYLGDDGGWRNIEATAGGYKYDSSYERELGITPVATLNEIYLRPLNPREAIGAMLSTAMEHAGAADRQEKRIVLADIALAANPRDVVAMVHKGAAYYLLLQERYVQRYPRPTDIPPALRKDFQTLSQQNLAWYGRAEALGWTAPTKAQDVNYMQNIHREKSKRMGN